MGGTDQYLHINPIIQGGVVIGYNIDFRGNFTVTLLVLLLMVNLKLEIFVGIQFTFLLIPKIKD